MEVSLARRFVAEVVGTGVLVLFGAGSVVAALRMGGGELDYAGLGMVAFAFAFAIAVAIYAFGTTSGAHINPASRCRSQRRDAFPGARCRRTSLPSWSERRPALL
jgi:glycerol uptake facilitator-like aquaporin